MTDKAPKILLPAGSMMAAVKLPATDVDIVSALRLMNPDIAAGALIEPYYRNSENLDMQNVFGSSAEVGARGSRMHFPMRGHGVTKAGQTARNGQRVYLVSYPYADARWLIVQCSERLAEGLMRACGGPSRYCRLEQVLPMADAVLAEMRDLVLQTPIRI
jgi:hypothetical protein